MCSRPSQSCLLKIGESLCSSELRFSSACFDLCTQDSTQEGYVKSLSCPLKLKPGLESPYLYELTICNSASIWCAWELLWENIALGTLCTLFLTISDAYLIPFPTDYLWWFFKQNAPISCFISEEATVLSPTNQGLGRTQCTRLGANWAWSCKRNVIFSPTEKEQKKNKNVLLHLLAGDV